MRSQNMWPRKHGAGGTRVFVLASRAPSSAPAPVFPPTQAWGQEDTNQKHKASVDGTTGVGGERPEGVLPASQPHGAPGCGAGRVSPAGGEAGPRGPPSPRGEGETTALALETPGDAARGRERILTRVVTRCAQPTCRVGARSPKHAASHGACSHLWQHHRLLCGLSRVPAPRAAQAHGPGAAGLGSARTP